MRLVVMRGSRLVIRLCASLRRGHLRRLRVRLFVRRIRILIVPPACRAKRTDNTSYTSGAALSFDLEDFDTDGMHDTVTNNDRITIQTAGIYLVVFNYTFNYSGTLTKLQANLNVNGSALAYNMQVVSATGNIAGTFPFLYSYSASDYISMSVILTGATSITNASGSSTTSLSATWLGRTS
jgi:hypothetical protein